MFASLTMPQMAGILLGLYLLLIVWRVLFVYPRKFGAQMTPEEAQRLCQRKPDDKENP